jgi:hypothetical protein
LHAKPVALLHSEISVREIAAQGFSEVTYFISAGKGIGETPLVSQAA